MESKYFAFIAIRMDFLLNKKAADFSLLRLVSGQILC